MLDRDGSGAFSLLEMADAITNFNREAIGFAPYWNQRIGPIDPYREHEKDTITFFPPLSAYSSLGVCTGEAQFVGGLLARPNQVWNGTRPGFGFTGPYAVLAKCAFYVNQEADRDVLISIAPDSVIWREDLMDIGVTGERGMIPMSAQPLTIHVIAPAQQDLAATPAISPDDEGQCYLWSLRDVAVSGRGDPVQALLFSALQPTRDFQSNSLLFSLGLSDFRNIPASAWRDGLVGAKHLPEFYCGKCFALR